MNTNKMFIYIQHMKLHIHKMNLTWDLMINKMNLKLHSRKFNLITTITGGYPTPTNMQP